MGRKPNKQPKDPAPVPYKRENFQVYIKAEKLDQGWLCHNGQPEPGEEYKVKRVAYNHHDDMLRDFIHYLREALEDLKPGEFAAMKIALMFNPKTDNEIDNHGKEAVLH